MAAAASSSKTEYGSSKILKIKGTTSYTTGGYDLPPSVNGTGVLNAPYPPLGINDGQAVIPLVASGKVKFMVASTGLEAANASDQSAFTVSVLVP